MLTLTPFSSQVIALIKAIPKGKIATYGQIAELAGKPQGARGVAWLLHSSSRRYHLPWHRVINARGAISFERGSFNFSEQKRRLQREGVEVNSLGELDLKKYMWSKGSSRRRGPRPRRKA
ncbi:MAG: MGMT family protein [Bdellovibrionales bacterium]|nr:MGMT family protein [Bdellovibrionales bacterium]